MHTDHFPNARAAVIRTLDAIDNEDAGRCPDLGAQLSDWRRETLAAVTREELDRIMAEAAPIADQVLTVLQVATLPFWSVSSPHYHMALAVISRNTLGFSIKPTPAGERRYPRWVGESGLTMDGFATMGAVEEWLLSFLGGVDIAHVATHGEG